MNSGVPIRVLVADSNAIFRQGVRAILEAEPDIQVVAQTGDARAAVAAYAQHRPDVTLLDLAMPETECVNAIKAIRSTDANARIVILTAYDGIDDVLRGLRAGASGYLLKESSPEEVVETVRAVHAGKKRFAPDVAASIAEHALADALTESERAVLEQMAQGRSNSQIAGALTLSESTVKFHVNNILFKLGAANRTEAVLMALKRGLVRLS
jgi:two-component system NarL family response regulator